MARVNHTVDDCHAVSAAVSIQSRAVKQVSLQCDFEGVYRLESADVMQHRQRPRATFPSDRECRCREWWTGRLSRRLYSAAIGRWKSRTWAAVVVGRRDAVELLAAVSLKLCSQYRLLSDQLIERNARVLFVYVCRHGSHGPSTSHVQGRLLRCGGEWRHQDEVHTDEDRQVDHGYTTSHRAERPCKHGGLHCWTSQYGNRAKTSINTVTTPQKSIPRAPTKTLSTKLSAWHKFSDVRHLQTCS